MAADRSYSESYRRTGRPFPQTRRLSFPSRKTIQPSKARATGITAANYSALIRVFSHGRISTKYLALTLQHENHSQRCSTHPQFIEILDMFNESFHT